MLTSLLGHVIQYVYFFQAVLHGECFNRCCTQRKLYVGVTALPVYLQRVLKNTSTLFESFGNSQALAWRHTVACDAPATATPELVPHGAPSPFFLHFPRIILIASSTRLRYDACATAVLCAAAQVGIGRRHTLHACVALQAPQPTDHHHNCSC